MMHNSHMRSFAAMMVGREKDAMLSARDMWAQLEKGTFGEVREQVGITMDRAMCATFDVLKRFGRWDAILAEPSPPTFMKFTTAAWRAARAVAYAAKKDFPNAHREHEAFRAAVREIPEEDIDDGFSTLSCTPRQRSLRRR